MISGLEKKRSSFSYPPVYPPPSPLTSLSSAASPSHLSPTPTRSSLLILIVCVCACVCVCVRVVRARVCVCVSLSLSPSPSPSPSPLFSPFPLSSLSSLFQKALPPSSFTVPPPPFLVPCLCDEDLAAGWREEWGWEGGLESLGLVIERWEGL